jgi:hypothetical protein
MRIASGLIGEDAWTFEYVPRGGRHSGWPEY